MMVSMRILPIHTKHFDVSDETLLLGEQMFERARQCFNRAGFIRGCSFLSVSMRILLIRKQFEAPNVYISLLREHAPLEELATLSMRRFSIISSFIRFYA